MTPGCRASRRIVPRYTLLAGLAPNVGTPRAAWAALSCRLGAPASVHQARWRPLSAHRWAAERGGWAGDPPQGGVSQLGNAFGKQPAGYTNHRLACETVGGGHSHARDVAVCPSSSRLTRSSGAGRQGGITRRHPSRFPAPRPCLQLCGRGFCGTSAWTAWRARLTAVEGGARPLAVRTEAVGQPKGRDDQAGQQEQSAHDQVVQEKWRVSLEASPVQIRRCHLDKGRSSP